MNWIRSPRTPAAMLLLAALLGLGLANSPGSEALLHLLHARLGLWDVAEWAENGLLSLFFLAAAAELREEIQHGSLRSPARAAVPVLAALGGVLVPIGVYLAFNPDPATAAGWPIPTATDIAFALGALAILGRGLPVRVRAFLLALAIVDDLVGILIIAIRYGADLDRLPMLACVVIGLALPHRWGHALRHAIEPAVNLLVLPVFAFVACAVVIPGIPLSELSPAFWGIAAALPLGKLVGITGAGWLAGRILVRDPAHRMPLREVAIVGALGGIGFTVALLLARLAFATEPELADEAVLGVLVGSAASIVLATVLLLTRRRGRSTPRPAARRGTP